jgi:hypothetical protein
VHTAIQALEGVADSQVLQVRRDKLDRAIQATEALSSGELAPSAGGSGTPMPSAVKESMAGSANTFQTSEQVRSPLPTDRPSGIPQTREGFWFNAGLGVGSLGCEFVCGDARANGLSGGLSLGGTLTERLLLGVGTTGWAKSVDNGEVLSIGTLDARLRFYPARTSGFFLTGGLGFGTISVGEFSESGVGVVLGIGWDIRVGSRVSLTPFYNGFAMRSSVSDANVGQLGLGITIH